MQKFIHDNFEIDFSSYQISRVEENQWFSDEFFTKYTFPFELKLTPELNNSFGGIENYNISTLKTYYKGYLFIDGTHEEAVLEIVDLVDKVATIEVRYGFDSFPNFEKKLAELPLEKKYLGESLFVHAAGIINQTWPAVNYNFPQVFTDSFDDSDDKWLGFEGAINNWTNGAFVINEFDNVDNLTYNRNIMIPMPYYLHVLIAGFLDAGYELKGDVLDNVELQEMLFYKEAEEYASARIEGAEYLADIDTYDSIVNVKYKSGAWPFQRTEYKDLGVYADSYIFPKKGKYKVSGNVYMRRNFSDATAEIKLDGFTLYQVYHDYIRQEGVSDRPTFVDFYVQVHDISKPLELTNRQIIYRTENEQEIETGPLWDLTITPVAIFDDQNELIPAVINSSKVDLTKCVPDTSFGDFVKLIRNTFNMDLTIEGKSVFMNYIEPQMNVDAAIDLNRFNMKRPRRVFSQGNTFQLIFKDVEHDEYKPLSVFVDVDGSRTSDFKVTEETNVIEINMVPLPLVIRNGFKTALAIDNGESSICAIIYDASVNTSNLVANNTSIMIPALHRKYWEKWLDFRINSQAFVTDFRISKFELRDLKVSSKVFMYNNHFLIRVLNKTNIPGKELLEVELEIESLK